MFIEFWYYSNTVTGDSQTQRIKNRYSPIPSTHPKCFGWKLWKLSKKMRPALIHEKPFSLVPMQWRAFSNFLTENFSGGGERSGAGDIPCPGNHWPGAWWSSLWWTRIVWSFFPPEQDLHPPVNAPWGRSHNRRSWPTWHAQAGAAGENVQFDYQDCYLFNCTSLGCCNGPFDRCWAWENW